MKERRSQKRFEKDSDKPRSRSKERRSGRRDNDGLKKRRPGRSREDGPKKFDRRSSGRRDSDRRGSDRRDSKHEMHSVICDECGKKCEVPFKPTSSKPIYCSECFKQQNRGSGRSDRRGSDRRGGSGDLDKINKKLDKIMKALKISE